MVYIAWLRLLCDLYSSIRAGESADYTLAVYSYTYGDTLKNVKITVTGGTVEGDIALTGGKNKTVAETVVISGGELTDVYSYAADEVAKNTISITGGTFAVDPSNYLADGYTVTGNGPYIVHKVSTGGGSSSSGSSSGSSSSSDSDSTAETTTTINPDGSTTTTSTKIEVSEGKDGSTTTTTTTKETTKETDGSTTKSETVEETVKNADGTETSTSKTETTSSNGSKSTTTVDETGKMETEVTVSGTAVKNATKADEAVTLPMPEVSATADNETAPTVEVTLPANAGETKVEIPVANPTAGTVVVIVHDDGTEEIVKTSVVSEDGVIVALTEDATIKVMDNSQDFIDVENNDWFNDASQFVSSREIMSGTSDGTFSPDLQASRGMIAVILHSLENDPENTYTGNFNDVGDTWYTDSIKWAAENGIMSGTGSGNFGPDDSVTREQLAVTLFAYANKKGIDTSANSALDDFNDADNTSVWAKEAVEWAVAAGLLSGKDGGRLDPTGTASRAEIAQILMAFCSKVAM